MNVESPAPLSLVGVMGVLAGGKVKVTVVTGGLVGFDAGTANFPNKQTADGQRIVTNRFSRQAIGRLETDESILWQGSLAIGAAKNDLPDQRL